MIGQQGHVCRPCFYDVSCCQTPPMEHSDNALTPGGGPEPMQRTREWWRGSDYCTRATVVSRSLPQPLVHAAQFTKAPKSRTLQMSINNRSSNSFEVGQITLHQQLQLPSPPRRSKNKARARGTKHPPPDVKLLRWSPCAAVGTLDQGQGPRKGSGLGSVSVAKAQEAFSNWTLAPTSQR